MTPGDEDLAFRQLDVFPDLPLMIVARVGCFEGVCTDLYLEDYVENVLQRDVVRVRVMGAAPADVDPYPVLWDAPQGDIQ